MLPVSVVSIGHPGADVPVVAPFVGLQFTPEPGGFQLFSLRLELSEEGLTRVSELILAAHHHLALITAMNEGERRAAWEELAEVRERTLRGDGDH
jgi:hypothetical protein